MRICWITSFPPKHSGIANYSSAIIEELKKLESVDILKWNYDSWTAKILSPLTNLIKLKRVLSKYDVVHIQYILGEYMFLFLPIVCLLDKRAKIVMTLHEDYRNLKFSWPVIWVHNIFYSCADLLMVHSANHKSVLSKGLQRKTVIIPFGIKKQVSKVPVRKNTVLLQGFINPWKGHDLAVRAVALVKKKIPDVKLIIAGKAYNRGYMEEIEGLIQELGVELNVELIKGFIPTKDFTKLVQTSEICVLPYRRITMSAILSDVVGFAKPCVASDLEAFKDYLKGKAVFFEKENFGQLAEKIVYLLGNKRVQNKMKLEFTKLAEENSFKNVAKKTYDEYKRL